MVQPSVQKWIPFPKPSDWVRKPNGKSWGALARRRHSRAYINAKFHSRAMGIKIARKIVSEVLQRRQREHKLASRLAADWVREYQSRLAAQSRGESLGMC